MNIRSINIFKTGVNKCLGELESSILEVLWSQEEPQSAREVTSALSTSHKVSFNAISTVLKRLEEKGMVQRHAHGKRYRFTASQSKEEYSRSIVVSGLNALLADKQLLSAAGLSGKGNGEEVDEDTIKLLKEFLSYADGNN
jgi:predicted transcriptional regulator